MARFRRHNHSLPIVDHRPKDALISCELKL